MEASEFSMISEAGVQKDVNKIDSETIVAAALYLKIYGQLKAQHVA